MLLSVLVAEQTFLTHNSPRTLGSLFFACSEERRDLSLIEAMQRLFSLALNKVRAVGSIAENAGLALVDAVMGVVVDMLQTEKRFQAVKKNKINKLSK